MWQPEHRWIPGGSHSQIGYHTPPQGGPATDIIGCHTPPQSDPATDKAKVRRHLQ